MQNLSKRAIASRANGKAIRHGFLSKCVVLDSDDKDLFRAHHENYIETFNPTDGVEHDLVEEMVASSWRLGRLGAIETALFKNAFVKRPDLAGAFSDLATGKEFELVHRYQSSVHRMFQHSFKNLILLRQFKVQETDPRKKYQTNLDSTKPTYLRNFAGPRTYSPSAVPMARASSSNAHEPL